MSDIGSLASRVVDYLSPSFTALFNTITDKVLPVLGKLWHELIEPMIPIVGGTFVVALKLLIDQWNLLLNIITPVLNFMLDHKQVVLDFAAAFGVLAAAMKFDDIKTSLLGNLDTIMGKIGAVKGSVTDLFSTISGGTAMGGIAVAGALADIALVTQAVQAAIGAINAMNNTAQAATADAQGQAAAEQTVINDFKSGKISKSEEVRILSFMATGQHALGTNFASTDAYIAGENGPELITGAKGTTVTPARQTAQMMNGAGKSVVIQNLNVNNNVDLNAMIRKIGFKLATA